MAGCPSSHQPTRIREETLESGGPLQRKLNFRLRRYSHICKKIFVKRYSRIINYPIWSELFQSIDILPRKLLECLCTKITYILQCRKYPQSSSALVALFRSPSTTTLCSCIIWLTSVDENQTINSENIYHIYSKSYFILVLMESFVALADRI